MPPKVQPKKSFVRRSQADREASEIEEQARKRKREEEAAAEEEKKKKPVITGGGQKASLDHEIWGRRRPFLTPASQLHRATPLAPKSSNVPITPVAPESEDAVEQAGKQRKMVDMEDVEGAVKSKGKGKKVNPDGKGAGSGQDTEEDVEVEEGDVFDGDYESLWQTYLAAMEMACPPSVWENVAAFLSKEIKSDAPSSADPISAAFERFREAEASLAEEGVWKPEWLVRPSGTLRDPLALLLHWPTFTTSSDVENGETADPGSPCPAMLLRKGVLIGGCLWLDRWARRHDMDRDLRNEGLTPMDRWSGARKKLHAALSQQIFELSQAKVFVLCGADQRRWFDQAYSNRQCQSMRVLINGILVQVKILYSSGTIQRIILEADHPESLYYKSDPHKGKKNNAI